MQTKITLHGAGVYYFSVTGAKDQPVFQSVFEFDYAVKILAEIAQTRLLAYVLEEQRMQFVLRCERDWTSVMDDIQTAFDSMHERCWHKRRQLLSDQGVVLMVDEQAFLTDLVMQLHDWPKRSGLVASAELWPWSSDQYYRMDNPPAWIDTESMLNLLSHSRRNRAQHYIDVMKQPVTATLDLDHGSHPVYQALARDRWVDQHMKKEALTQSAYSSDDIRRLFDDACQLVARQFDITVTELCDSLQRRRYNHLMPLVVWLLRERGISLEAIAPLAEEEEDRLQLWLRGVPADHTENVRRKLLALWSPEGIPPFALKVADQKVPHTETDTESLPDSDQPEDAVSAVEPADSPVATHGSDDQNGPVSAAQVVNLRS